MRHTTRFLAGWLHALTIIVLTVVPLALGVFAHTGIAAAAELRTVTTSTSASGGPYAYVTNGFDRSVSVVDLSSNTVVATVVVGVTPLGVTFNPAETRAYVANRDSNTVSVIDTATHTVVAEIPVGALPHGVVVTPDGARAYVTNRTGCGGGSVSVIDTATNTVIATIPVDPSPQGISMDPTGTRVYVSTGFDCGPGTVQVIDTTSDTVVASVPIGASPSNTAISPTSPKLYVTNLHSSDISVVDTSTLTLVETIPITPTPRGIEFTPDGSRIYVVSSGNNIVTVLDAADHSVITTIPVGGFPLTLAFNAMGTRAYLTMAEEGSIAVIDTVSNTVVATVPVGTRPVGVAVQRKGPSGTPPTADADGPYAGEEGAAIPITGAAADADEDPLTTTWTVTAGSGVDAGASCSFADPNALETIVTCSDDGTYTLTLTVSDGVNPEVVATTTLSVSNVAPTVSITSPGEGALYAQGDVVDLAASFSDQGSNDTHTCSISWDDGTTTAGTVSATDGAGTCTSSHTFASAGVYTIQLTVTDDDGASVGSQVMVVVYDPSAGFVTGGGWIPSPAGAYPADPEATGTATFGFVSKYQKGATVPSGNTEFRFDAAGLRFRSDNYQWLVVAGNGAKARYKGTGTLNGADGYGFLLTAYDGGTSAPDRFRIKIWDAEGTVVYDNRLGTSDDLDAADPQVIGGGSIIIHTQ